jgi:amino acid transporter
MRYTHRGWQRTFRVPFGPWLIPIVGSLLCILLMKGISKETVFRFLVWTAIGQIVYFSYGFWHSKIRRLERHESVNSTVELLATISSIMIKRTDNGSEADLANETIEDNA